MTDDPVHVSIEFVLIVMEIFHVEFVWVEYR